MGDGGEKKKKQQRAPWWRSKWARRVAVLVAAAALGASCPLLPDFAQPACAAAVKALHFAGVP